ncbi:FtsK/SpoIIIE family DNA translocase [Salinarimonas rosea]|uniref:FtsK/SpoIIIE family DNA translocase n=1 Tax=Salinarimonas rosea TaxID=552063 RepID=UPI0003FF4B0B|nr:DNA translocase FtsK [Salinarimonas rosea]
MPARRRAPSPADELKDALRGFLRRRLAETTGLVLLAAALALALALATWSVEDPSLNHATDGPVRNLLGFPGAVAADLVMQLVGLGAVALIAPLALWGWQLLRAGALPRLSLRIGLLLVGAGAATAVAAALPATARWPLPTGLGGVAGDALLGAVRTVTGIADGPAAAFAGFVFAAIAILSLTAACGYGFADDEDEIEDEVAPPRRRGPIDLDDLDEPGREDDPGRALVWLGAVAHGVMSARGALRRGFALARAALAARHREEDFAFAGPHRREPVLDDEFLRPQRPVRPAAGRPVPPRPAPPRPAPRPAPAREEAPYDDDDEPEDQPGWAADEAPHGHGAYEPDDAEDLDEAPWEEPRQSAGPAPAPRQAPARPKPVRGRAPDPEPEPEEDFADDEAVDDEPAQSSRVQMPVATLKPGKRIKREAQPNFLDESDYELPPLQLLAEPKRSGTPAVSAEALEQNATLLESTLEDFGVRGEIINVRPGPVVTLYELEPAPGTKSSRVISLADDIARSMSAVSARVAVVPGRNAIGIELPNAKRETVYLRELLASHDFEATKHKLALCLGKTIGGEPVIADLARMPHLLVAGTTGSGKSVAINTMILSLLYRLTPEQCRLIMVDPKMLELSIYDGIPHLLSPVVTDPKKAVVALKWAVREMEDRYRKMSKLGVRNIDGFNARVVEAAERGEVITRTVQTGFDRETGEAIHEEEEMDLQPLPYIVVIVDEMADLMMVAGKEIEGAIQRLAQMARAAGIHLIMATQRPSVDVITGTIKANFPTRISFQVTSKIDSRTILGEMGAEQLLGQGDMLHMAGGGRITRVHGPFCSDDEVEHVVSHLKRQGRPSYLDAVTLDEEEAAAAGGGDDGAVFDKGAFGDPGGDVYDQAVAVVLRDKKASTSYIQRRLQIGYNRAASLMERMEREGIVGPANHAGKREILMESAGRGGGADLGGDDDD